MTAPGGVGPAPATPTWRRPWQAVLVALTGVVLAGCAAALSPTSAPPPGAAPGLTPPGSCAIPPGPVAVAVGSRANSPVPTVTPRLTSIVTAAITSVSGGLPGPTLTLVRLDGRSDQVTSGRFASDAANPEAFHDDQAAFLSTFAGAVAANRAAVAEADDLAAIATAARAARDAGSVTGTVVLLDSGLSTAPPLDLSVPGALDANTDETVVSLAEQGAVPDLRGQVVIFIGLGDVAFPSAQEPLDEPRKKHLVELYAKIAHKGGAACVEVVASPRSGPAAEGVPPVRPVPVPRPVAISTTNPVPTVLPDDPVTGFVPETADLLDRDAARTALRPLAEWLRADPHRSVLLSGTTARVGPLAGQQELGRARAETIEQVLAQLGVQPAQMESEGLGSEFPQYVPDHDAGERLLPAQAHANRSVRLTPSAAG